MKKQNQTFKLKLFIFSCFEFLYLILFSFPSQTIAVETGLSISPPIVEAVIKPGKNIIQTFNIQNLSFQAQTLVATIVPFQPSDNGLPILRPDLKPNFLNYFSFANTFIKPNLPFTLAPNAKEQIILNITIPNTAPLSDIYVTLLVSTQSDDPTNDLANTPSSVSRAVIGSNILLSVNNVPNPQTSIKIDHFVIDPKSVLLRLDNYYFVDSLDQLKFNATAINTGPHYTKIGGIFKVSQNNKPASLVGLIPLNLLANSGRSVAASPSGEIIFQPSFSNIGNFLAELDLRSENSSAHEQLNIIILPFKISLTILLVLTIIFAIYKKSFVRVTSK